MMGEPEVCIGIDIGSAACRVAANTNGKVEVIANDQGNRTTPSYVSFTVSELLVGEAAKVCLLRTSKHVYQK